MTYRLLALDLDGTLMGPDLVISDEVRSTIAQARELGIIVTVATGRVFNAALPFIEHVGITDPIICHQGALIRHPVTREIYTHTVVPASLAVEAIEMLQRAGIFVIAYVDEWTCVAGRGPELELYLQFHPGGEADVRIVSDLVDHVRDDPPTKLLFIADPPVLELELAALAAHFTGRLSIVRSYPHFGEITAPGITKGAALASLAERLDIDRSAVIAIGDEENDMSMLAWAGLGLAMGNAPRTVQDIADAVIPAVTEHGVARAIETYLLDGNIGYRVGSEHGMKTGIDQK